jgi:PAS domain S-box-containing protein
VIEPDLASRVLAAIGDAVVVIDREHRICLWSGAAEQLLGLPAQEALGKHVNTIFPGLSRRLPEEMGTLSGNQRLEAVRLWSTPDTSLAVVATPLRDEAGEVVGTTALLRRPGGFLDPAEHAGRPRRQWHRALGAIVHNLVQAAEADPSAMDASEALARSLVTQAKLLLPSAECLLAVVPRERQEHFHILAGAGPWAEQQVGKQWPLTGSVVGRALDDGRSVESMRLQETSALRHIFVEGNIVAGRMVPLLSARPLPDGRRGLGVLGFYRTTAAWFTPYERRLITEFARLVSLSLQRSELLRSTKEAEVRLRTGADVAVELARTLEPDEVIGRLVRRAATAVDAERVALLLVEGEEAVVVDAYDGTGQETPVGARFPIAELRSGGEPLVLWAMRDRGPRISGGYQVNGDRSVSDWGQAGIRHTLTLPLVLGGRVNAVLLVSRLRDVPFRREDALTLQLVGNVAVLALRNARLFTEAQEANRERSDFLNMAAHELRTPLTVLKGYLEMMSDGSLGEPPVVLRQPLDLLSNKAEELSGLIDDLLFTSRLESGRLPAHPMRLDLRYVVNEASRRAQPRVHLLGGELVLELPKKPLVVNADPEHIARILDNLVNNALTYRRADQTAWVRLWAGLEDGIAVVSVEDRGRGIPPEMQDRIFERFVRGQRASGGSSGTGLGLYISRQLAARHGGWLELDLSVPGHGSRFSLRLPGVGG